MFDDDVYGPVEPPLRSPEELERIAKAAREAKTTIIAVAMLSIGGIVLMFLITIVLVILHTWG